MTQFRISVAPLLRFVTLRKKQFPVATCYEMYYGTWCLTPVAYTVAHCYVQCFVLLRYCSVTSSAVFRMCYGVLTTAFFTQCHFMISSSECHKYWPDYYLGLPVGDYCYLCYYLCYLCYLCYYLDATNVASMFYL